MTSRFIEENEKAIKKQKRMIYITIVFAVIIFSIMIGFRVISVIERNPDDIMKELRSALISWVFIIIVIGVSFAVIKGGFKKVPDVSSLRNQLKHVLKTQEDYTILDNEYYGDLKRNVTLGSNNFIFTPHFLIESFKDMSYKVFMLQYIKRVEVYEKDNIISTKFIDDSGRTIGEIENNASYAQSFIKVCREQIPWAEFE